MVANNKGLADDIAPISFGQADVRSSSVIPRKLRNGSRKPASCSPLTCERSFVISLLFMDAGHERVKAGKRQRAREQGFACWHNMWLWLASSDDAPFYE